MAARYKPLRPIRRFDADEFQPTDDQRYWMHMQEIAAFQQSSGVVSCDFKPAKPFNLVLASGYNLTVFDSTSCEPVSIYSRFKSPLAFVKYRSDGALLGVSTQHGLLQFFDVHAEAQNKQGPRNALRTYKAHKSLAIPAFDYSPDGKQVASFAADGVVKLFDLSTDNSKPLWTCNAHSEPIKAGIFIDDNLLATGANDHKIKVWDIRQDGSTCVQEFDHGSPVEKMISFNDGKKIISSGGSSVKFWGLDNGGDLIHQMDRENVTCMCLTKEDAFLIIAGVDRRVNVVRLLENGHEPVHAFEVPSQVLSISVDCTDNCVAIGMDNQLAIYRREEKEDEEKNRAMKKSKKGKRKSWRSWKALDDQPLRISAFQKKVKQG